MTDDEEYYRHLEEAREYEEAFFQDFIDDYISCECRKLELNYFDSKKFTICLRQDFSVRYEDEVIGCFTEDVFEDNLDAFWQRKQQDFLLADLEYVREKWVDYDFLLIEGDNTKIRVYDFLFEMTVGEACFIPGWKSKIFGSFTNFNQSI